MSSVEGVYIIWRREVKRYVREKSQLFSTLFLSLVWLIIFGTGIGSMKFGKTSSGDYGVFLFPGIIGMVILITSLRSGVSIIRDIDFGFLRVLVVSPASTLILILGKTLGDSTVAMSQGVMILLLSFIVDIPLHLDTLILSVPTMLLISAGLVALGLIIASFMRSFEGFNIIMSLLFMPMFFLSGALFPIEILPGWLKQLTYINPLTYGVDALRHIILGTSVFPLLTDMVILICFDVLMVLIAVKSFEKKSIY
ncbi:MAG: ABC transporter permease [Candidatus Hydrothermarchaeales archaeon]